MNDPGPIAERQLFDLLDRVMDLPGEEREEVLAKSDPRLAAEVRAMLDGEDPGNEFLAPPSMPVGGEFKEGFLGKIGPYTLLETLGEGGMGRVFLAEQHEPVRRRVAIKVLRFSVAGREARVRFEAERHAMGRLNHPNIGRILEAGTTADGLPFFAMEYIDGSPITHYSDQNTLNLANRLELFIAVCRGAEYAHGKLLLHRDLKPSNILVAEFDGKAVPKIIDFGIVKGLDGSLSEGSLATGDQLIGTPSYMSPEALSGKEPDIRSDIFSLGVLLYELLTGTRPWAGRSKDPMSILQRRLENDLRPPSTQVARLDPETLRSHALRRGEEPGTLSKKLRGDLDWIVLKAVSRDPSERYGSAAEFAADVERFLRDEPVMARPATASYLLRKLVRRHRAGFGALLAMLLAIVLGSMGTAVGFVRARQAETEAQRVAQEAVQARDAAQEVADFLVRIFRTTGIGAGVERPPQEVTALELLERGAARLDGELTSQPLTKARLSLTIGVVYRELGLFEPSGAHFQSALELFQATPEASPRDLASAHLHLANHFLTLDQPEEASLQIARGRALVEDSLEGEERLLQARFLAILGRLERRRGNFEASERHFQEAAEYYRAVGNFRNLPAVLTNLGSTYFTEMRWVEAEAQFREVLEIYRIHNDPGALRRAMVIDNLAAAIASQDRLQEALPLFEQALAERRRLLGDHHPDLGNSLNNLGMAHLENGHPVRAEELHREALALREKTLGAEHPHTAWSLDNLARALADQGRRGEAIAFQRRALEIREKAFAPDHPQVVRSREHLAELSREGEPQP